ncbi:MAG: universal stress protein [Candidatus Brocadiales bacterium]
MVNIKRILCPVDYSVSSSEAMKYAAHIAGEEGAKVYLIHVIDVRSYGHESPLDLEMPKPSQENVDRMKKELVEDLFQEKGGKGVEVEAMVVMGKPVEEILKAAKEQKIDMIVMGTHGRTGIPHVIVGSVAENVIRKAPCPVLTVRQP